MKSEVGIRFRFLILILLAFTLAISENVGLPVTSQKKSPENSPEENELFSDSNTVVDSSIHFHDQNAANPNPKSVGLSGSILTYTQPTQNRAYFSDWDVEQSFLNSGAVGTALLDIRMREGFRAFADLEWSLNAGKTDDSSTKFHVPETFLDANIHHKIWLRMGKQVLQWGRGWFFNPTDLINVEHKSFFRRIGGREGVYGAKVQVPFGTAVNLYGFLDVDGVSRLDSVSGAVKAEFLIKRTELALMAWDGGHRDPVYGADLSSRVLGLDVTLEAALYQVFQTQTLLFNNGIPSPGRKEEKWQSRMAVGLGRSFSMSGIPNRVTSVVEYYFNEPGSENRKMPFADLMRQAELAGFSPVEALALASKNGAYEPNSYSRHYVAFFTSLSRFILSDMTLSFNAIGNLNQNCAMLSTTLGYRNLNNFGMTLSVNGFAGPIDREYTLSKQATQIQITAEVFF